MSTLSGLLGDVLAAASAGPAEVRSEVGHARDFILADVVVAVTGRRGAGKTTLINELLTEPVLTPGYTAEDQPVRLIASQVDGVPPWATGTRIPAQLAERRRYIEIPEHLVSPDTERLAALPGLAPDVLVHVVRRRMHSDERDLLRWARRQWRLSAFEILVVGEHPAALDEVTSPYDGIRLRLQAVERLVVARRGAEVIQRFGALAARCDDRGWAARVVDDLEQLCLGSQGHVLRERWALETCFSRPANVPKELRDELVRLTLCTDNATADDRPTLLARAAHWRTQLPLLPPLAAEVSRVVVRTLQLHATPTQDISSAAEGARS
jgi:hypothetical protein